MARFAAKRGAIRAAAGHAVVEFAMVRIQVTRGTSLALKLEGYDFVRAAAGSYFVALVARHGHVRARECEMGFAVIRDRKRGAVKIQDGMATLAAVLIGSGGKLPIVRIFVAIQTGGEFHFVHRILACRNVALGALDGNVLALQRILRRGVFVDAKEGWLPAV